LSVVKTPWCCVAYARLDSLFQWFLVIILNRPRGNHSGRRWSAGISLRLVG